MNKYFINESLLTCILNGKMDTLNASILESEIDKNLKENITSITFDLKDVDYISSAFLRIVIKTVKALGKENFTVLNVQPSIMKVFKIANLTEIIKIK